MGVGALFALAGGCYAGPEDSGAGDTDSDVVETSGQGSAGPSSAGDGVSSGPVGDTSGGDGGEDAGGETAAADDGADDGDDGDDGAGDDAATSSGGADEGSVDDGGESGESSGGAVEIPSGTFLMDDEGYVVFDFEEVAGETPPDPWVFRTDGPCGNQSNCEYMGSGYYQFTGANMCGQTQDTDVGVMEVQFEVKEAGMHRFAWRNLRDHTGGCGDDRNNDSFIAFPSTLSDDHFKEPFKVFGGGHGNYNWTNSYDIHDVGKERVCVEFEPGVHTVRISGRSNAHAIDRIAIIRIDGDEEECRRNAHINGLDDRPLTGQAP